VTEEVKVCSFGRDKANEEASEILERKPTNEA